MTRAQLNKAVSRATGDDASTILSRGFSLVEESSPIGNEDLEALIEDWNRIHEEKDHLQVRRSAASVSRKSRTNRRRNRTISADVVS